MEYVVVTFVSYSLLDTVQNGFVYGVVIFIPQLFQPFLFEAVLVRGSRQSAHFRKWFGLWWQNISDVEKGNLSVVIEVIADAFFPFDIIEERSIVLLKFYAFHANHQVGVFV